MEQLNQWNNIGGIVATAITFLTFCYGFFKWFPTIENRIGNVEKRLDNLEKGQEELKTGQQELNKKIDTKFEILDKKIDTKFEILDKKIDTKFEILDKKIDTKFEKIIDILMRQQMQGVMLNQMSDVVKKAVKEEKQESNLSASAPKQLS